MAFAHPLPILSCFWHCIYFKKIFHVNAESNPQHERAAFYDIFKALPQFVRNSARLFNSPFFLEFRKRATQMTAIVGTEIFDVLRLQHLAPFAPESLPFRFNTKKSGSQEDHLVRAISAFVQVRV